MTGPTRTLNLSRTLALVLLAIVLAFAFPVAVSAQEPPPGPPPTDPPPPGPPPEQTPAPTPAPDDDMPPGPPPPPGIPPDPTPTPGATPPPTTPPGGTPTPTPPPTPPGENGENGEEKTMRVPAPTRNSIVMHAATPAQLVKSGDGKLNYYFIGADGSASTGPTLSSFEALAEMYPSGAAVSLYSGVNPMTHKPVDIDYLPDEMKIVVRTYYPDSEYAVNKPYVFTVTADYAVTHVQW